jgi:hypothetical protein
VTRSDRPAYRRHTALKFAAGFARVFAVLIAAGSIIGAAATLASNSAALAPLPVASSGAFAIFFLVAGLIYAVLFWAGADALVMLADSDDAHRLTQFQLAQLTSRIDALQNVRAETQPAVRPSTNPTERLPPPA